MVRGGASASPAGREFEIAYVDAEYGERRLALIDAWSVPFEECMPVRGFPSYKGQSLLGLRDGIEPDWWITSEDGADLAPGQSEARLLRGLPARRRGARGGGARAAAQARVLAGAAHRRLADACRRPTSCATRDNAIPPAAAGADGRRAGIVSHIDASHSPFLSRPDEVTAIIQETLAAVVAQV